jgi:peroxiredoxin Q/BCP
MKLRLLLLAMSFSFFGLWASAKPLDVGADAPKITATNQDGAAVDLGELYKKGLVLVYFYPKADTGGCTAQACSLRDEFEVLTEKGVTVVGVSTDKVADQKAFQEKYNLPFTLIADPVAIRVILIAVCKPHAIVHPVGHLVIVHVLISSIIRLYAFTVFIVRD